jgi:LuxR family maltose regulon positive regulatory protein
MKPPIIATKLFKPPLRPKAIHRPHLTTCLDEGQQRQLTLISAPAGFGKTTLVSEWIAGSGRPVAWLSLDSEDNDLARFLIYLVSSLQTIPINIGDSLLGMLESPQPLSPEFVLTILLNEISSFPDHFFLIIDDYHVIDAKPVNDALAFLLEHLPQQMHLVIVTREDPPLSLALLRARGQLTELRAADLRFSLSEAAVFLSQVMGLNLSDKDIADLENRTEGWITGLQLAAISMQGQTDTTGFIRAFTGSHRYILDYLIEEVLQQQPENVQHFLLYTSILDRICGPLCDAVLLDSSASGQETLGFLERANLFIVPLDNERRWYRYHHLFADLLRRQLHQITSLGNEEGYLAEYHIRASRWYEENDDLGAAFHHAVVAGDFVRAVGLAEAAWPSMNGSFQSVVWLGWVKKLPEDVIRVRPMLCTHMGRAFADAGEPEASELRLQDAERCLDGLNVESEAQQLKPLPAMIALVRASNAQMQGNLAATVKYAELALQIIPEDDFVRRAQAIITSEVTHWSNGNLESTIRAIGDWMDSMTRLGNYVFVVASAFAVADLLVGLGRLNEAERTYQDALQLAAQHGPEAEHITAHHHLGLSMIYRQWGDDTLAAYHLKRAAELGLQTTLVDWQYRWHVAQAWMKEAVGDFKTALALLNEAKRAYIRSGVPDLRPIAALKARIYLKQGRPDKTREWAAERGLSLADEASYLHEFEHLTLARLEIANPLVNDLLVRLLQAAEAQNRRGSALDILLVQVLAHEAQGNCPQALAALKRVLSLAEPEGYVSIFVDEGEPIRKLIKKQSDNRDYPLSDYEDKLLVAFTQRLATSKSAIVHQKSDMIEPLSERELEVLKLLRTELSGPEIAKQLFISLNTFRTHTKSIFNKLGVNNRRGAVCRAEELDLF